MEREKYKQIFEELNKEKSMIFLSGPRQSGKTTLSSQITKNYANTQYFNWDILEHRARFIQNKTFFEEVKRIDASKPLIILDEIHKYKDWKNYLKGIYDAFGNDYNFLITGSGRLDVYKKGGDSIAGRYYQFHMFPFTISELSKKKTNYLSFENDFLAINMENFEENKLIWNNLAQFSGFPEPYIASKKTSYNRWSNTYSNQLIREDIQDLTAINNIYDLESLFYLLPTKVGSSLSINSLAQDLKVSFNTIVNWINVFEQFYLVFRISVWTEKVNRSILKEKKLYIYDNPRIENEASRFENMVAVELYKSAVLWTDLGYGKFSLHFIKDKDGKEVDFLLANNNKPILIIEAKYSDDKVSKNLLNFQQSLNVPAVQLVNNINEFKLIKNGNNSILVAPACQWLANLPW